jgi:arylsulfatase
MDKQQNIILVTIDSLRADHCSYMGYARETTPTLDSLAEGGLSFRNAIAPGPSTSESMPAIFTGEYPFVRRTDDTTIDERIDRIEPHLRAQETLAEQFSAAGYETAAFTPNPFTTRYFGFDEGFDYYQDFLSGTRNKLYEQIFRGPLGGSQFYMPLRIATNWINQEEAFKPWTDYYDEVIEWIGDTEDPYFLWIFLMDVHHP